MSATAPDSSQSGLAGTGTAAKPISPLFPYLVGGLLHDVNNSLTVLMMSAELGRSMSGPEFQELMLDTKMHACLQHVAQVVRLMQSLARDYYAPGPQTNDSMSRRLADLAERKRKTSPGLDFQVKCDERVETADMPPSLILFLAGELLFNAAKACGSEAGHHIQLTVATEPADNTVSLCILDDGPGFTAEKLTAIRNGQLKPPADGAKGGYGLYFVNEIALRLHGQLLASNRDTGGARVEVLLPFHSSTRP